MNSPETSSKPEPMEAKAVQEQAQRAKALVKQIFDNRYSHGEMAVEENPLREELEALPREALVLAAWQGIANHEKELTAWGNVPRVQRLEAESEYRKSLLTPEEQEQALSIANDWLDDNFSK